MAYSRWSDSFWYTYWEVSDSRYKKEQFFVVMFVRKDGIEHTIKFRAGDLRRDLPGCLVVFSLSNEFDVNAEKLNELTLYIEKFLADVESDEKLIGKLDNK